MILVKEKAVLAGAEEELPVQAVGEVLGEALGEALEEDVHHRLH
ncbi:hypothetical protein WD019_12745 [Fictibacillus sp. Mic-4]